MGWMYGIKRNKITLKIKPCEFNKVKRSDKKQGWIKSCFWVCRDELIIIL